jgi:tetratricopeptide (TPR) repeat protein
VVNDLGVALKYSHQAGGALDCKILANLGWAEEGAGNWSEARAHYREAIAAVPNHDRGLLFHLYLPQVHVHSRAGDLTTAEQALTAMRTLLDESRQWPSIARRTRARWESYVAHAEALLFDAKGDFVREEASYRKAIALLADDPIWSQSTDIAQLYGRLGRSLAAQGRATRG